MATSSYGTNNFQQLEKQISGLKNDLSSYEDDLAASPTAYGGSGAPSSSDIYNHQASERLRNQIQGLRDQQLKAKWYLPDDKNTNASEQASRGILGSTLDFLARPLYGVVGATKHLTGQGKGSLWSDVADNMVRERDTFRDVLRNTGVPGFIASPLGFMLDIAGDPVNWATMGAGALIPRLGYGMYKGAKTGEGIAKGFATAARSRGLEAAATAYSFVPKNSIAKTFPKIGTPMVKAAERLGTKALDATKTWEDFSGLTVSTLAAQRGFGIGNKRVMLGDVAKGASEKVPGGKGILEALWYSPHDHMRQMHIKDVFEKHLGYGFDHAGLRKAFSEGKDSVDNFMNQSLTKTGKIIEEVPPSSDVYRNSEKLNLITKKEVDDFIDKLGDPVLVGKLESNAKPIVEYVDGGVSAMNDPSKYIRVGDHFDNALRLTKEELGDVNITMDDVGAIIKAGGYETGWKWWDDFYKKSREIERKITISSKDINIKAADFWDKYEQANAFFKVAKVGGSIGAFPFAIMGNLAMRLLAVGNISGSYMSTLNTVRKYYMDADGAAVELRRLLESVANPEEMFKFIDEYKSAARSAFGVLHLKDTGKAADQIYETVVAKGQIDAILAMGLSKEEAKKRIMYELSGILKELKSTSKQSASQFEKTAEDLRKARKVMLKTESKGGTIGIREAIAGRGAEGILDAQKSGFMSNELFHTRASTEMFAEVERLAALRPEDIGKVKYAAYQTLHAFMNKLPSAYDKVDQSYKLATFIHAMKYGFSVDEIRRIRHLVDITPEELTAGAIKEVQRGRIMYRLSPQNALELANVMFLNYNAMPSAIRALRVMPVVGSPFVSFMYGMALKTGQTLAYNPSAFNKITFGIQDFSGEKSPLEKRALEGKYYSYLNEPSMYRMPNIMFFKENPTYLNLENMIPYYTLSIFGASQAKYGDTWRENIAKAVHKSPFIKDPVGATIFDYIVLPTILGDTIRPQGAFGQPLYPADAGVGTRALYGARTLAEAYTPNILAYTGLLGSGLPDQAIEAVPLYKWRSIARAAKGQNQLGISTKDSKAARVLRGYLSASGIPIQAQPKINYNEGQ